MISVVNIGIYQTLLAQLQRLARHNRHGSFKTRERYFDAMKRFCVFLSDQYRLEKLANISGRHLEAYVLFLQKLGRSPAYIKTELSAIRLFHDLIPEPRHNLPNNATLGLERRQFGGVDRTWQDNEYKSMCERAFQKGCNDYADMLTLIRNLGLRLHECARLDTAAAEGALKSGSLTVKGKGGKLRSIPVNNEALAVLRHRLDLTRRGHKLFVPDNTKTDDVMHGLERFIIQNRNQNRESGTHLTIHGLRHTYAAERYSELISAGWTPYEARKQVSQWLGHERDSVTKIYLASLIPAKMEGGHKV